MTHQRTAVVDLDNTLSQYDHWRGEDHFGKPIKHAGDALHELKTWGWRIVIFTTRGNTQKVEAWLRDNAIPFDAINDHSHNPPGCSFKPIADVYFDDREANVVGRPYDWRKAMKRVRRMYQPDLDVDRESAITLRAMLDEKIKEMWP